MMDLVSFSFFYFYFILDLDKRCGVISYVMVTQVTNCDGYVTPVLWQSQSHNYVIQRRIKKVLEQIMSYSITIYCLYKKHIYFRIG